MENWFNENLGWMYWTLPTAIMFTGLFLTIAGIGIRDHFAPSYPRKGFLPIPTTPGDRLFIGILITIAIHILWILLLKETTLYPATGIAAVAFATIARWG